MKLSKDGKTASLPAADLEVLVQHVDQFEKLVKEFERQEKQGTLAPEWQRRWKSLRGFLDRQEQAAREREGATPRAATTRCCVQSTAIGGIVDCREYRTRYVFALAACVGTALVRGLNATLSAGRCSAVSGCP